MAFSNLWQGWTGRLTYLADLVVSSAAILLLPFVAGTITAAVAPGPDPAFSVVRLLLRPTLIGIGFLIVGGALVVFTRRRMRELGLSGVWLILFPLAPLLMLFAFGIASGVAMIWPMPITSPVTAPPFWIQCAFGLLLAVIPGGRSLEHSGNGILRFAHRATACEGRLGRAGFALHLASAAGLAFAAMIFVALVNTSAQQSGLSMAMFMSVLASASVLLTILLIMFATASTIRRLHDLNLRGWWIILFPFGVFSLGSVYILFQLAMNPQLLSVMLFNPFMLFSAVQGVGCPILLLWLLLKPGSGFDNAYGAPVNAPDRGA